VPDSVESERINTDLLALTDHKTINDANAVRFNFLEGLKNEVQVIALKNMG
jgi:hypothetical protein